MKLFFDGVETTIPFTFKSLKALANALKAPKIADLEQMLNKIGFDNCSKLTSVLLKAEGLDFTESQVEDAIEDAGYPIRLVEAIGKALAPSETETKAVVKAINEGN